jgi:predicted permease
MARSFREVALQATGFAKDHLLMVRFDPRLVQYDAARTQRFYELLAERARQAPGVRSAALTLNPPLGLDAFDSLSFVPDGYAMPPDREAFTALLDTVDAGYFETLEIPILRGRAFQASDTADAPRVAIVNEQLARRYWPAGDAVGQTLRLDRRDGAPVEIVGVAPTLRYHDTNDLPVDFVYVPLAQRPKPRMVLLLRSHGDPLQLVETVRQVVRSIDPHLPLLETRSYEDLYRYSMVEGPGVAIRLVGSMGAAGLLLAMAGLYGLVAYNVSRRTREIGVRMAIGAGPRAVLRLVMGKGLTLVAIGTLIGVALGFGVEKLMDSMLFRTVQGGFDLVAYLVVVPSMLLVTLLAAYLPARRATRISPTLALRCE